MVSSATKRPPTIWEFNTKQTRKRVPGKEVDPVIRGIATYLRVVQKIPLADISESLNVGTSSISEWVEKFSKKALETGEPVFEQ